MQLQRIRGLAKASHSMPVRDNGQIMGPLTRLGRASRGRWNDIRSLVPAAVRRAGVRAMAGGARRPLSIPWEVLRAAIPDKMTAMGSPGSSSSVVRRGLSQMPSTLGSSSASVRP